MAGKANVTNLPRDHTRLIARGKCKCNINCAFLSIQHIRQPEGPLRHVSIRGDFFFFFLSIKFNEYAPRDAILEIVLLWRLSCKNCVGSAEMQCRELDEWRGPEDIRQQSCVDHEQLMCKWFSCELAIPNIFRHDGCHTHKVVKARYHSHDKNRKE